MRIAAVVALFVVVLIMAFATLPTAPAAGQTVPPTETPKCQGDCSIAPTPRPDAGTPYATSTPDPNCPAEGCGPIPTPRPDAGTPYATSTPDPACPEGGCFPFPTPRPTYAPGATIEPAGPNEGMGFWHYAFVPIMHK